jgi:hypothetical protein
MIALVRGATRFTFAPFAISSALVFGVGPSLTFVDLKPLRGQSHAHPWPIQTGKDSEGIRLPSAIFTGRKCCMVRALAKKPGMSSTFNPAIDVR